MASNLVGNKPIFRVKKIEQVPDVLRDLIEQLGLISSCHNGQREALSFELLQNFDLGV